MSRNFRIDKRVEVSNGGSFEEFKRITLYISEEDFNNNKRFFTWVKSKYMGDWSTMSTEGSNKKDEHVTGEFSSSLYDSFTKIISECSSREIDANINIGELLQLNQNIYVKLTTSVLNIEHIRREYYRNGEMVGTKYDTTSQDRQITLDKVNDSRRSETLSKWEFTMNYHDED